jgi:hypothetical protein
MRNTQAYPLVVLFLALVVGVPPALDRQTAMPITEQEFEELHLEHQEEEHTQRETRLRAHSAHPHPRDCRFEILANSRIACAAILAICASFPSDPSIHTPLYADCYAPEPLTTRPASSVPSAPRARTGPLILELRGNSHLVDPSGWSLRVKQNISTAGCTKCP